MSVSFQHFHSSAYMEGQLSAQAVRVQDQAPYSWDLLFITKYSG